MGGLRELNIKMGMPYVDQAIARLTAEITASKKEKYAVLKIIHGYGSSGVGGRLRTELRKYLAVQKQRGVIRNFVAGEDFSIFNMDALAMMRSCDEVRKDHDLDRSNNGITLILL